MSARRSGMVGAALVVVVSALVAIGWVVIRTSHTASPPSTSRGRTTVTTSGDPAGPPARPGSSGVGDHYYPGLGNGGYDVEHYTLAIRWNPDSGSIEGRTTIAATTTQALSRFNLDLTGLAVRAIEVDGRPAKVVRRGSEVIVTPAAALRRGRDFTTVVVYEGRPKPQAFIAGLPDLGWITAGRSSYVIGEPAGAATFFPSNNHPSDKATYSFAITVPAGFEVAANGVRVAEKPAADRGSVTWRYEATDPMATYLVQVAIGDFAFEKTKGPHGLVIRNVFPRAQAEQGSRTFARQAEMIRVLEGLFGPFPFDVYGALVVKRDLGLALECQTLSIFGQDTISGGRASDATIVHELAHQWFGDSVGLEQWKDVWLNEGFATYAEWVWREHNGDGTIAAIARQVAKANPELDKPPTDPGAADPFKPSPYLRGALTLQALREKVGERDFAAILSGWARRYRHATATTTDFIALAEEVSGEQLDDLFNTWLYEPKLPSLP